MSDLAMLIFGFGFIFAMTTLGSSIVYFLKKDISTKANYFRFCFWYYDSRFHLVFINSSIRRC